MTDHYQAALDACRLSEAATWKSDPDRAIQAAQVHATLALAEQQRIANLIALNEQWEKSEYPNFDAVSPMLRPEIAQTLRIEDTDDSR